MISIVIPTKNSERTIEKCLQSIRDQTYKDYELIIVDGNSTDSTASIAKKFADLFIADDSGRTHARNIGFSRAKGEILLSIDSDMVLEKTVLQDVASSMDGFGGLIIPEVGYGDDFISKCKDLEKRCYVGDEIMESARAFSREAFRSVEGYDPGLVFGEDWDIHYRIKKNFKIGRIRSRILHIVTPFSFVQDLRKSYLYGKTLPKYVEKGHQPQTSAWLDPKNNFFIRHFPKLIKEPVYATGLFIFKSLEYVAGILGLIAAKLGLDKNVR